MNSFTASAAAVGGQRPIERRAIVVGHRRPAVVDDEGRLVEGEPVDREPAVRGLERQHGAGGNPVDRRRAARLVDQRARCRRPPWRPCRAPCRRSRRARGGRRRRPQTASQAARRAAGWARRRGSKARRRPGSAAALRRSGRTRSWSRRSKSTVLMLDPRREPGVISRPSPAPAGPRCWRSRRGSTGRRSAARCPRRRWPGSRAHRSRARLAPTPIPTRPRTSARAGGRGPASLQLAPPSTLTSTRSIAPWPDQARPRTVHGPGSRRRSRVANSGNPGRDHQRSRHDPLDRLAPLVGGLAEAVSVRLLIALERALEHGDRLAAT